MTTNQQATLVDQNLVLENNSRDKVISMMTGLAGAIPFAGPLIQEVFAYIPNQRMDRLKAYLLVLGKKVESLEARNFEDNPIDPVSIKLIEDGAFFAVRAVEKQRRIHIANIVANGICGDSAEKSEAELFLKLLDEVTDDQILILASHLEKNRSDAEFQKRHEDVIDAPFVHSGSTMEEADRLTVYELKLLKLNNLGLLESHHGNPQAVGNPKPKVTPLGRLLLYRLGLADRYDC